MTAGNAPQVYAEGLLEVCRHYLQSPLANAPGISGGDLKRRVEKIMAGAPQTPMSNTKKFMLTAVAAATVGLPLTLGALTAPAAAQTALITKPVWDEKPTGLSFVRLYPKEALAQKISGKVVLLCRVASTRRLSCKIADEAPAGQGFGAAALAMYPELLMAPKDGEGKATVGRSVRVPITFKINP
jgi:TonB family protein